MSDQRARPLILQSDMTVMLEVAHPEFDGLRSTLGSFADLEKSPEHIHTYRITPLSIWNAASAGVPLDVIREFLVENSKYEIPQNLLFQVEELYSRYGRLVLRLDEDDPARIILESDDPLILTEAVTSKRIAPFITGTVSERAVTINPAWRGFIKKEFIDLGYPVRDEAGYRDGAGFSFSLREQAATGKPFGLREYQIRSVERFWEAGKNTGGCGVIVLPCGAGKTIVGMAVMHRYQCQTLILTTNIVALRQWKNELLDKTDIPMEMIGEYSGDSKEVRPVTIATYNILTWRRDKESDFEHFGLFMQNDWGLIIYDEVHLLPAPVFRVTAELQSRRRLGLTATLVREDGLEKDVFSLIGPKKYDVPWKDLEKKDWIAKAVCHEIRVEMARDLRMTYVASDEREKFRLASENPAKLDVIEKLLVRHADENVLIIGQYLDQLDIVARTFSLPVITGATPVPQREQLYRDFREGRVPVLVVSKVANFAIDLPDASVAIQISGTFGSRQEEAQRLGRILRPKGGSNEAVFYTVITRASKEQQFASNRQLFLTEQGYSYTIENWQPT
ncbi:MAG TPA: DEAD/DEAH box helicase [Spirochaetota bacterium]|nr:DEAD/DEAH box helicase [Spirochaetota bacterium]HPN81927.1 DEAD/DEAH box helicase [Spirochaetota bacterium]